MYNEERNEQNNAQVVNNNEQQNAQVNNSFTETLKAAITGKPAKMAAIVAVTLAVSYGGYRMYDSLKKRKAAKQAQEVVEEAK